MRAMPPGAGLPWAATSLYRTADRGARVEGREMWGRNFELTFEIVILFALQRTVSDLSIQSTASDGFAAAT